MWNITQSKVIHDSFNKKILLAHVESGGVGALILKILNSEGTGPPILCADL